MGFCTDALQAHDGLALRRLRSEEQLQEAARAFAASPLLSDLPVSAFCAGSLARREAGTKSDMDVFVTADAAIGRLREFTLFAEMIAINKRLSLPEFSNDGAFLKVHCIGDLLKLTGSPEDDSENLFTVRMLLILESEPVLRADIHLGHLRSVLDHYYRDEAGKKSFRPLFLLNDLLRYWRTLCLNYEQTRHDSARPWRKKNVNLKFSRMVTVFGTVLPLVIRPIDRSEDLVQVCRLPALERLAGAIDELGDKDLESRWGEVLNVYDDFLQWKEEEDPERFLEGGSHKAVVRRHAETLSQFLFAAVTHDRIRIDLRRYLVL